MLVLFPACFLCRCLCWGLCCYFIIIKCLYIKDSCTLAGLLVCVLGVLLCWACVVVLLCVCCCDHFILSSFVAVYLPFIALCFIIAIFIVVNGCFLSVLYIILLYSCIIWAVFMPKVTIFALLGFLRLCISLQGYSKTPSKRLKTASICVTLLK